MAEAWTRKYPWFQYDGPAGEEAVKKWKAHDPGAYPAPHAEGYQAYAVDKYCAEVLERVRSNGGMMMWGAFMLVPDDSGLVIKDQDEKPIKVFWMDGADLKHGDMGTFALFRMGYMVGDLNLTAYLMDEEEKFALAIEQAKAKLELPTYKGNPKAFTQDTGFIVTSMDLESVFNGDVWVGYKSVMNVD